MGAVLTLGVCTMTSADRVRLAADFRDFPELDRCPDPCRCPSPSPPASPASIVSVTATCSVPAGGTGTPPAVSGVQIDDPAGQVSAVFSGGTSGLYDVTWVVHLDDADGSVFSRTGVLRVL